VRRELNYPDLIYLRLKDKVGCFVARSTVNQEDMLGLVRSAIVVLNKMV